MPVYFANREPIDLAAIELMGVSVKEGPSPIGFFGTGLKFAIATLLRTGHRVVLHRTGEEIRFETIVERIRGSEFQRIVMRRPFADSPQHVPLGITTQLGRTWEPWQAYRELRSNAMDEGGVTSDAPPPGEWGTLFEVSGEGVEEAHRGASKIFLERPAISGVRECSVHHDKSGVVFYRGVRAADLQMQSLFTYNILHQLTLTEDRTIRDSYYVPYFASKAVSHSDNEDLIEACVVAPRGTFEHELPYNHGERPSPVFLRVVERHRRDVGLNLGALSLWEKFAERTAVYEPTGVDGIDEDNIQRALVLTRRLGSDLERGDFVVVESLGTEVMGRVWRGQIYIARAALDKGPRYIAGTLYEEWLHRSCEISDESRAMQNLLLDRLLAMTERVHELEKRSRSHG